MDLCLPRTGESTSCVALETTASLASNSSKTHDYDIVNAFSDKSAGRFSAAIGRSSVIKRSSAVGRSSATGSSSAIEMSSAMEMSSAIGSSSAIGLTVPDDRSSAICLMVPDDFTLSAKNPSTVARQGDDDVAVGSEHPTTGHNVDHAPPVGQVDVSGSSPLSMTEDLNSHETGHDVDHAPPVAQFDISGSSPSSTSGDSNSHETGHNVDRAPPVGQVDISGSSPSSTTEDLNSHEFSESSSSRDAASPIKVPASKEIDIKEELSRPKRKWELCYFFTQKQGCRNADQCNFIHAKPEPDDSLPMQPERGGPGFDEESSQSSCSSSDVTLSLSDLGLKTVASPFSNLLDVSSDVASPLSDLRDVNSDGSARSSTSPETVPAFNDFGALGLARGIKRLDYQPNRHPVYEQSERISEEENEIPGIYPQRLRVAKGDN